MSFHFLGPLGLEYPPAALSGILIGTTVGFSASGTVLVRPSRSRLPAWRAPRHDEESDLGRVMKVIFWMLGAWALHAQVISEWAFGGPDHRLHYLTDNRGNSIMDFSSAGYRGGGVKLPSAAAAQR